MNGRPGVPTLLPDAAFLELKGRIIQRTGHFYYQDKNELLWERLLRRMRATASPSSETYLRRLDDPLGGEAEWSALEAEITIGETFFFRYAEQFAALQERILPELIRRNRATRQLRIWSAGCATGAEPYSIAITACETFGTMTPPVRIIATDIDTQVLATAQRGVYPVERVASLSAERKRRFFQRGTGPNEGHCRVHPALQALIEFRPLNLLSPRYDIGGPFAAVFCRNVMIYFDKPTQRAILSRLVEHMGDDGLLYTGHSENYLHAADLIQPCGRTLYRRAAKAGA